MTKTTTSPFGTFKPAFPGFDADQFIALQQRNVDALTSAGQIVVDSAQAIALRQSEMMQSTVGEWLANGQQAFNGKPAEFKPADQVAKFKAAYEAAVNNAKELSEIALKAQTEALGVLTKCMVANLDDLKSLAKAA